MDSQIIEMFSENKNILTVYQFGSYGTEFFTAHSDIDFAILFKQKPELEEEMYLQACISIKLSYEDIDLVNMNTAPLILLFNIISEGKIVYEREKDETDNFVERVIRQKHANEIRRKMFYKEYDNALKEAYANGEY